MSEMDWSRYDLRTAINSDSRVKEAYEALQAKRREIKTLMEEAGPELDATKVTSVKLPAGADLRDHLRALNDEVDERKDAFERAYELWRAGREADEADRDLAGTPKDFGALVVASEAIRGYHGGGRGPVATIPVTLRDVLREATLFQTTGGWSPESTRIGRIAEYPLAPVSVVDVIPQFATTQAAIKYMEEQSPTQAAAEVAEAAAYPEATLSLTEKTVPVQKVAVFLPTTDEQLEDVDGAREYIDSRLRTFLRLRMDRQVLQGNGTAPNLLGTENVTGINSQAQGTDTLLDAIYKAMVSVRSVGFAEPSIVLIKPADWQTIRLSKTADGIYLYGAPADAGPERVFGVPVLQTTQLSAGAKAVLGDYARHAGLFSRRGIDVQVSNSHGTFFVEGKLAIRADVRVAMVHFRPSAFAKVV